MFRFLALASWLLLSCLPLKAEEYAAVQAGGAVWRLVAIIDGDTFRVETGNLPPPLSQLLVRVRGIDTPEIGGKAKCRREAISAEKAKQFTERFLAQGTIRLDNLAWDKYGGRILADVYAGGRSLARNLLSHELARAYDGGKRDGWC